jgi:hypothetical protein
MLWMGIGSPFFTRRMETATQSVLDQMKRPAAAYDARGNYLGPMGSARIAQNIAPINPAKSAATR